MQTICKVYAARLIDYAPGKDSQAFGFAESQLDGAVAAYNMLATQKVAYVADEVGMGKTYVALGVLGLLRHANPEARALIIAPRENIQRKWVKELSNFVRSNWQAEDNRFKNLRGGPVRKPIVCHRLRDLAYAMLCHAECDPVMRMTTFSVAVNDPDSRRRYTRELAEYAPWIVKSLKGRQSPDEFITRLGFALNGLLPTLDLVIIDEAHNLRHGFGRNVSNRNRLLGVALGHDDPGLEPPPWYKPKAKRVLLLSATPFECDYGDIARQLDVLGKRNARISMNGSGASQALLKLRDETASEAQRRELLQRLMLRRVGYMNIAGAPHSKNMYRREWRRGGYLDHDSPMRLTNDRERLVVALIQKKVTELLGDERFKNSFQIGMLSSFESFLESLGRRKKQPKQPIGDPIEGEAESAFDLTEQTDNEAERRGVDTGHVEAVSRSYREKLGEALPHPKLDATTRALTGAFETGEKALVFVRRVATVGELKAKLDQRFDEWLEQRMRQALPRMESAVDALFAQYKLERRGAVGPEPEAGEDPLAEDLRYANLDEDQGGSDTFFAWFFRGTGPAKKLSGAAMQKNRFGSASAIYATFFEDDYVSWLLDRPLSPLDALAEHLRLDDEALTEQLRRRAFGYYQQRTRQKEGYPRYYVYEAYQAAALSLLADQSNEIGSRARVVLQERFAGWAPNEATAPDRFLDPGVSIGVRTLITELQTRMSLRAAIWPEPTDGDFRERFREREQRRELLSAMCRLGAAYIDLYLIAIRQIGTFELGAQVEGEDAATELAIQFLDALAQQQQSGTFGAFAELRSAAASFDTILAVNFPDVPQAPLPELAEIFGRTLQHQVPVGGMSGGVNKRVVQQFRMPGFPLVLVTTDVLQEGEDLHTFCRRVIHYGIAWTPSAVEQRTGRVDRIGGLVQRELDGCEVRPKDHEWIQVHYPHLADTIEVLQVRRVLERINRFLLLSHSEVTVSSEHDSRIDINKEMLGGLAEIPRITGLLKSAFDDTESWLGGELGEQAIHRAPIEQLESLFARMWQSTTASLGLGRVHARSARRFEATAFVRDGRLLSFEKNDLGDSRRQAFVLSLRSQISGDGTLVHCESTVGRMDLDDAETLDQLYSLQQRLGDVRVCARPQSQGRTYLITIEQQRLFDLKATQVSEIEELIETTVVAADTIEREILAVDAEVSVGAEDLD